MNSRRKFLKKTVLGAGIASSLGGSVTSLAGSPKTGILRTKPLFLSTWNHGFPANDRAMEVLKSGESIVDAVEKGVMVTENDLDNLSVGLQGLPDREGIATLDASIMKGDGSCGSVAFVRQVKHPISLARRVMDKTPHVMIVGEGARQFAISEGFPLEQEVLSEKADKAYREWKIESEYKPIINIENHDTIGMIGLTADGRMAGACTTSGLAYKMHGRVGDSPIIGAGLFVDEEVGAATATGLGEAIIRVSGSFLIVELMRQGRTPQEACEEAVLRLVKKNRDIKNIQAGFIAFNKDGDFGAYAVHPGFNFASHTEIDRQMIDAASYFK